MFYNRNENATRKFQFYSCFMDRFHIFDTFYNGGHICHYLIVGYSDDFMIKYSGSW